MEQVSRPNLAGIARYDPTYDPLIAAGPGHNQSLAPTYWAATAGTPPLDDGPIAKDIDVDVAVIGGGYTGLATAIFLAKEHGIRATVLEANRLGWGCSGRNGGQSQNAGGRLSRSQWVARWGIDIARRMHEECTNAYRTLDALIRDHDIACDPQPGGHLYVAHRAKMLPALEAESRVRAKQFGYECPMIDAQGVRRKFVNDTEAAGAMHEPDGTGVHPLKLVYGCVRVARELGASVHPASPVLGWDVRNGIHYLRSPGGIVRARAVAIATGAYTSAALHPSLAQRYFPVLSNSIVTRALTRRELEACNWLTTQVLTDTRTLRFYYRRLPDDRVQIGSRSAITGRDAPRKQHMDTLTRGLHRKFPALKDIEVDYSWWGWVDVSHDMMPRVCQPDGKQCVVYALGYGGNGVSFSFQAGRRMAQKIAGKSEGHDLPILSSPLPRHALAPFRRIGQWLLYRYYYLKDEFL
jgi:taurine dehydrogenase large subunit